MPTFIGEIVTLLQVLGSLSPLAVIALLGVIIWMMVRQQGKSEEAMHGLKTNDLHELPEIADTLRRMELLMTQEFAYIRARLNGKQ